MPQATYGDHKTGHGPIVTFVALVVAAILAMAVVDAFVLLTLAADGDTCAPSCSADTTAAGNRLVLLAKLSGLAALLSLFLTVTLPRRIRWQVGLPVLGIGVILQAVALVGAS
ncbi:hypothetical protein [Embleya scabrispora]|uniref:hypothetical protein n=1 Tax=Embleya scabrispora TaxID=159449 RepID=UPI000377B3B1|nr:hypothetical protein [Embleya scabrispora]MYS84514.1 hypothetical protein [Streptomyces sp. SID5474]